MLMHNQLVAAGKPNNQFCVTCITPNIATM